MMSRVVVSPTHSADTSIPCAMQPGVQLSLHVCFGLSSTSGLPSYIRFD